MVYLIINSLIRLTSSVSDGIRVWGCSVSPEGKHWAGLHRWITFGLPVTGRWCWGSALRLLWVMPVDQPFLETLSFYVISFQIKESASQTRDVLKQHFNDLKGTLAKLLDERLVTLLQEVDTIEQETIKPLDDCQKLIEHGVNTAEDLVQEGGSPGSLLNAAHSGRRCAGFPGHQQASCHLWVLRLFVPWESLW